MKVKKGGEGSWLCEYNETGNSPILGIQLRDEKGRNDEIRVGSEVYSFLIIFILDFRRKKLQIPSSMHRLVLTTNMPEDEISVQRKR